MALDHVRDFFHSVASQYNPLDLHQTSVPIFLTRWVTHFCAPVFVFLAGTSAFLTSRRKGKKELSKFLFTRGLWLVIAEVTFVNFGLDFFHVFSFMLLQTIWALGFSMIALSALIYLPKRLLLVIALAIICGHNALDQVNVPGNNIWAFLWSFLHNQQLFVFGTFRLLVAYPVLPWIGVMSAGYCFGEVNSRLEGGKRKKILAAIGLICIIVFIALRLSNKYGDMNLWSHQKNFIFTSLSFINTTKYPPSLLYILMTLGPAILFLAIAERRLNKITTIVAVYGRVPLFYYLLHIYFIHVAFLVIAYIAGFPIDQLLSSYILNPLPGFGFNLSGVYVIWIGIVSLLYPLCKRYDAYKMGNKDKWWLSYL
jgi:uncharacterized membrane protein